MVFAASEGCEWVGVFGVGDGEGEGWKGEGCEGRGCRGELEGGV